MSTPDDPTPEIDRPTDPGLQPERTALAWRRTALACGVGAFVALRTLPARYGTWALIAAVAAAALSLAALWVAHARYHAHRVMLTGRIDSHSPDGKPIALLAGLTVLLGLIMLVAVVGQV